ncbi:hypothetical protein ACIRBY_37250 [Streptomyces sp. NPDC096136]|uniref:hypothetical protein n=1 Tax=Streptomyces sp. NPDC096136 TaxID=3366076 RepID=UPI003807457B
MTSTAAQLMIELADHAAHLRQTMLSEPLPPTLAANLRDSARNRTSAALYFAHLHAQDWQPRGGYPGSDVHWPVLCIRCGWEGEMFNSHMRRNRRHRGCPIPAVDLAPIHGIVRAAAHRQPDRQHPLGHAAFHLYQALESVGTPEEPEHLIRLDLAAEYLREARTAQTAR